MSFVFEPKGTLSTYTGTVRFDLVAEGSKQEHKGAVLDTQEGNVRLFVRGDNPFEANLLRPFEGSELTLSGVWKKGVLIVEPSELKDESQEIQSTSRGRES